MDISETFLVIPDRIATTILNKRVGNSDLWLYWLYRIDG
uniref:Uncharacterized protein n=1 Tax=Rhizophora mucronata TaxID=61149 RepID=A0A2P2PXP2_RHIMU